LKASGPDEFEDDPVCQRMAGSNTTFARSCNISTLSGQPEPRRRRFCDHLRLLDAAQLGREWWPRLRS